MVRVVAARARTLLDFLDRLDAGEIRHRHVERGLLLRKLTLRRLQTRGQGFAIDLKQRLAGAYEIALDVEALFEKAVDTRADLDFA